MAAITGATNTTTVTELVPDERILQAVGDVARSVPVAMSVAAMIDASGQPGNVLRIPRWDDAAVPTSESSGKTETDQFAATAQAASEASITAVTVGIRKAVADEADLFSQVPLLAAIIRENGKAMLEQFDEDLLTQITSATNTSNFSGLDFTIERWGTALAGLRANATTSPGSVVGVFHDYQVDDLRASLRASGLGFGLFQQAEGRSMLDQQSKGLVGILEGVPVYSTKEVPQFDANNWSGAFVVVGDSPGNSGLAAGIFRPIMDEMWRDITRQEMEIVTTSIYGTCIVRNDYLEEVVTSKT